MEHSQHMEIPEGIGKNPDADPDSAKDEIQTWAIIQSELRTGIAIN